MAGPRAIPPLRVFLSYSHKDEKLCKRFLDHLSQLKRDGLIEPWHDRRITAGSEWAGAIDEQLNSAHIIILLVSANFLASDYSNDVEMARALERSQSGEARVVAVILKPCDWETSRFAKLQVLPKGGKPVVEWPTEDHGFVDAVKGLRRLIGELCGPGPVRVAVVQTSVRRHPWRWLGGVVLAAILIACLWLWSSSRGYLKEGTDLLNAGLYSAAREPLERARKLNPLSTRAGCGLSAAQLDTQRYEQEYGQRLNEANQRYPDCAYLAVLTGDEKYRSGDREGALADYRSAVKQEPQLAEAFFNMGVILELEGNVDSALPQYQKAVDLSGETARYRNNLGALYFKLREYDKAVEQYGQVVKFPLSALELAIIYRLQGKLDNALARERAAIGWLQDPRVQASEEQTTWETGEVRLVLISEKQCYAQLELSATTFLKDAQAKANAEGAEARANTEVTAVFEKCSALQPELKRILASELYRLGSEVPAFTQQADRFTSRFLNP